MIHSRHLNIWIYVAILMFSSCKENDPTLSVSSNLLEFDYTGGVQTITIESDDDWSLYGLPDWLNASKQSGVNTQEVILTAIRNTTGLDREQVLSLRSNNSTNIQTLRVKQYANSTGQTFSVNNTSIKYFNGTTSEREDSIVLQSSVRWRITGPDWLAINFKGDISNMTGEIREGGGTIYLRCCRTNTDVEARKDTIKIQTEYGDEMITIPVEQLGIYDVKCVNTHILSDGFWFSYKYGYYTQKIMSGLYEGIMSAEQVSDRQWKHISEITTTSAHGDLKPNTYYTIFTRVMPSETSVIMKKVNVDIVRTASEIDQPRATISDMRQNADGKWSCKVTQNGLAKGYYYTVLKSNNHNKTYCAARVYQNIGTSFVGFYTEDSSFSFNDDIGTFITWAVGNDGKLSDVVDIYKFGNAKSALALTRRTQLDDMDYTYNTENVEGTGFETPIRIK